MRIIVKLFSLVVKIVKSQSSQSRPHFSRSGYHRWCPFSSRNVPESSHSLSLQPAVFPKTCTHSSLWGAPRAASVPRSVEPKQWFFRKSPQLSPDPSRALSHVNFTWFTRGLVNVVPRPQAWRRFAPVLGITVSTQCLDQSLTFHGYLSNERDRGFTVLLVGWWVL